MKPTLEQIRRVQKIRENIRQTTEYAVDAAKLDLTEQILERLETLGLTRADLAQHAGVSTPYVTKILRGHTNFTVESLVRLAAALDCHFVATLKPKNTPPEKRKPAPPKTSRAKQKRQPHRALALNESPTPYRRKKP